ncbi:hypothetical protein M501DRAFT_1030038 [Patellaria atrata CBS 101060]|uniref:Tyrosine specific protein phosphatases domain-containing protein n=1 Tax=Patellaria atrata CBS 101060 TaxID=1346257 RepID=A0A9P4VPG7_9PEZI|nr:hypothetical protein M501DRAFT_1030038 [Patellaria atrata CBS 101060]
MATALYGLPTLLAQDIFHPLPVDPVANILSHPSFLPLPGALNFRDIAHAAHPHPKPNLIYCAGALTNLTDDGKRHLTDPGVTRVYDLCSKPKRAHVPAIEIAGVRTVGVFGAVLRGFLEEDGGLVFCCTAGKGRTGVLAAVVLGIVGAPRSVIAADYVLTRIGTEPAREVLLAFLLAHNPGLGKESRGFRNFCQTSEEVMEFVS